MTLADIAIVTSENACSAPVEGRISGIVDIPNACCTLAIPTEIFAFDVKPSATGPINVNRSLVAAAS